MVDRYSQVFIPPGGDLSGESAVHLSRRRRLLCEKGERPLLVLGTEQEPGGEHLWWSNPRTVVQEPEFLYLTGINQPGFALLLDPTAPEGSREILFVPESDRTEEFWTGPAFGISPKQGREVDSELARRTGITDHRPASSLVGKLQNLSERFGAIDLFLHDYPMPDGAPEPLRRRWIGSSLSTSAGERLRRNDPLQLLREALESEGIVFNPVPERCLAERVVFDSAQLHGAEQAQRITHEAFEEVLPEVRAARTEADLHRLLEYRMLLRTPWGTAFPTIVASGENGCVLHHIRNDAPLVPGDLVLLDFGARWGTAVADISRTLPVSGTFDPLQRLLYQIVLDTQLFHERQIKPGRRLYDLNGAAWDYLEEQLQQRFFSLGGTADREYNTVPHGISHLIGEQVHEGDPFRLSQLTPLLPGMMISNEPGLYGTFTLRIDGTEYRRTLGIRIEDDLVVTPDGCRNLSRGFPKTVEEIEKGMAKGSETGSRFGFPL